MNPTRRAILVGGAALSVAVPLSASAINTCPDGFIDASKYMVPADPALPGGGFDNTPILKKLCDFCKGDERKSLWLGDETYVFEQGLVIDGPKEFMAEDTKFMMPKLPKGACAIRVNDCEKVNIGAVSAKG